jgi:hypothetical protein
MIIKAEPEHQALDKITLPTRRSVVVPPTAWEAARRPNGSVTPGVNCAGSS